MASASVLRRECSDDPLFPAIEEVLRDDILRHTEQVAACLALEADTDDRTLFVCNYDLAAAPETSLPAPTTAPATPSSATVETERPPVKPQCLDAAVSSDADIEIWEDARLATAEAGGRAADAFGAGDRQGELEALADIEVHYRAMARAWEAYLASVSVLQRECRDYPEFSVIAELISENIGLHNTEVANCLAVEALIATPSKFVCYYRDIVDAP